jgi:hypothetical protein
MTIVEIAICTNTVLQLTWFSWVIYNHYRSEHKGEEDEQ